VCEKYNSLAKRLQELSVTFRQSQRKYLADVQIQKSGGLVPGADTRFAGIMDLTSGNGGDGTNGANAHAATGEFFTTQQLAVVDDLTEAVRSRDVEIIKIAQSIEELGTIFKELAVLVIDQGTILDRIDYNMEAVVEHTKTGLEQLTKAESAQKSARPLRCIICLSSLIFFLLIILVLKHRPRRGWF
jgi:syntaxin 16